MLITVNYQLFTHQKPPVAFTGIILTVKPSINTMNSYKPVTDTMPHELCHCESCQTTTLLLSVQSLAGYTAKLAILFSCYNAGLSLTGGLLFDNSFLEPLPLLFQRRFETMLQTNSVQHQIIPSFCIRGSMIFYSAEACYTTWAYLPK